MTVSSLPEHATKPRTNLPAEKPREFICDVCGRRCTSGPDGDEYGHERGVAGSGERCPKRPESVDPKRFQWGGSGD